MKPLDQYETPETEDAYKQRDSESGFHFTCRKQEAMANMEQRLAACREALEVYADRDNSPASHADGYMLAQKALELTKP